MEATERWMSTAEAAALLGRSPVTLTCWRSAGTGPRYFHTGRVRYRIEDVREWEAGESERRRARKRERLMRPDWMSDKQKAA